MSNITFARRVSLWVRVLTLAACPAVVCFGGPSEATQEKAVAKSSKEVEDNPAAEFDLAIKLVQAGETTAAVEKLENALKKQPQLFANRWSDVEQAFRKANKSDELYAAVEKMDLKAFRQHPWIVGNMLQNMFQDEKQKDRAVKVFKKAWEAMPDRAPEFMQYVSHVEAIWKLPDIYDYLRKSIIPPATVALSDPWRGVSGGAINYHGDGRMETMVTRALKIAKEQQRLDKLSEEIEASLVKHTNWHGGRVLSALIQVKRGQHEPAKEAIVKLLDEHKATLTAQVRWLIGQEIEEVPELLSLAMQCLEGALEGPGADQIQFEYGPAKRLVHLYSQAGKKLQARDLLLKHARRRPEQNRNNAEYDAYRQINQINSVARQLHLLGFDIDAIRLYREINPNSELFQQAQRINGDYLKQQIQRGLAESLKSLKPESLSELLASSAKSDAGKAAAPLDMLVIVEPPDLDKAQLQSLVVNLFNKASAEKREVYGQCQAMLAELRKQREDDLMLLTLSVLTKLADKTAQPPVLELEQLVATLNASPLPVADEILAPLTAEQRNEVKPQIALWLVARECLRRDETSDDKSRSRSRETSENRTLTSSATPESHQSLISKFGTTIGERALAAARLQPPNEQAETLAILREWGQLALDQGDKPAAEQRWSEMLSIVLPRPVKKADAEKSAVGSDEKAEEPKKADAGKKEAQPAKAEEAAGTTEAKQPPKPAGASNNILSKAISNLFGFPPATARAARGGNAASLKVNPSPIPTPAQFEQAAQIARLAARNGLTDLSLRAIRDALRYGPPMQPLNAEQFERVPAASGFGASPQDDARLTESSRKVEEQLAEIESLWRQKGVPESVRFETLRSVVFPEFRPNDLFLYPQPLAYAANQPPRSVGLLLARAAADSNNGAGLRERITPKLAVPALEISARVLLAQLAAAERDSDAAQEQLAKVQSLLLQSPLQSNHELAAHAAMPATLLSKLPAAAVPLLEGIVAQHIGNSNNANEEPTRMLTFKLAKHYLQQKQPAAAQKHLDKFLTFLGPVYARYGGDYGSYRKREVLLQIAGLYAEHRQLKAAFDALGQFADMPVNRNYGSTTNVTSIAKLIYSSLAGLSADERYELLKTWSLPVEGRQSVRSIAAAIPATQLSSPPAGKAQFDPALTPGNVLLSSTTMLVDAAQEAGKLDQLGALVKPWAEKNVENAKPLWQLIQITRGDGAKGLADLRTYVDERKAAMATAGNNRSAPPLPEDFAIARQALLQPELRDIGLDLARSWLSHAQRVFDHAGIVHIRRAISLSEMALIPDQGYQPTADPGLTHWVASSLRGLSYLNPVGAPSPWWIAHEGMIVHLGGADHDCLHFAYPLTGSFEISADCFAAAWGEANLTYGGLLLEALHGGYQTAITAAGNHDRIGTHDPVERFDDFNRVRIKVEPGQLQLSVNGHLVYRDHDIGPTSPWLGLYPFIFQTAFKNVRIHGDPIIPREVKLTDGDRLEGWVSHFYGETQPPRRSIGRIDWANRQYEGSSGTAQRDPNFDNYDWAAEEGVLHGRRQSSMTADSSVIPSRLFYHRPLRDHESVRYEFFFDPGVRLTRSASEGSSQHVHPTLGRLAFLLDPSGVRLYRFGSTPGDATAAVTDSADVSDTDASVTAWNVTDDAFFLDITTHRRGPKQLPLKPQEWNTVELSLTDGIAKLSLNETLIFERPFAATHDLHFGFFHDKARTAAKIRNVVLTGDWPTSLTPELRADLLARTKVPDATTRHAMAAAIGEQFHAKTAQNILAQAQSKTSEESFEFLANWVLPGDDHLSWRLYGELAEPLDIKAIAPALELAAVAVKLKKLEELSARLESAAKRVAEVRGLTPHDHRAISALQLLIAVAKEDRPAAMEWLTYLLSLDAQIPKGEPEHERWPELFAVFVAMRDRHLLDMAELLATRITDKQTTDYASWNWENRVRHARDWCRSLIANRADKPNGTTKTAMKPFAIVSGVESSRHWPLKQWTPRPVLSNWEEAFVGTPRWELVNGEVAHRAGMGNDLLFFQSPLRGTFKVEADLATFGWREIDLFYSTVWARPRYDLVAYEMGGAVDQRIGGKIEPRLDNLGDWCRVRLEAAADKWTLFVNDRKIHEQPLAPGHDPWLAIHTSGRFSGGARNVRITGTPEIPDEISLSSGDSLVNCGWIDQFFKNPADYIYESNGSSKARPVWEKSGDEIRGQKLSDNFSGSFTETLLEYHRPLAEDGAITYEFYCEPGQASVHPALGRLAFLLREGGIAEHVLTHGAAERRQAATSEDLLLPDNTTVEESYRRGPAVIPLKGRDWNRMRLAITGNTLTLALNEVVVYERLMDSIGLRTFGLFRFADQTEARVRNIRYRGDWPKSLPDLKQQELTYDSISQSFAATQWAYTAKWNFRGPPPKAFIPSHDFKRFAANAEPTETGMKFKLTPGRDFPSDLIGFMHEGHLRGDFEIIGRFKIHKLDRSEFVDQWKTPGFDLGARLAGTENYIMTTQRSKPDQQNGRQVTTMRSWTHSPSNQPRLDSRDTPWTAMSGRQRIIRKGSTAYYLMADGDSDEWRILDKKLVDRDDINTIVFFVRNFDSKSHVEIELQELTVSADECLTAAAAQKEKAVRAEFRDDELPVRWSWNFQGKLPPEIKPLGAALNDKALLSSAAGYRVSLPAGRDVKGDLVGFESQHRLQGDFEVTGKFSQLNAKRSEKALSLKVPGVDFAVRLELPENEWLRLERRHFEDKEKGQAIKVSQSITGSDGQLKFNTWLYDWPANAGRFKIVRKGTTVFYLTANGDSTDWKLLREETASTNDVAVIQFAARNYDPESSVDVLLQELTIKSARLIR